MLAGMTLPPSTCDLCDEHGARARVLPPLFRHFGGKRSFAGQVVTARCPEDNTRLKELAGTPGNGRVLVVDGGGSQRYALLGDMIGKLAQDSGWAGIVIHGLVRDAAALATLDLGVMALGTTPRRSLKNGEGQVELPITIVGITVVPGDRLFADEDGIVLLDAATSP
ncbi:MAG: ribonuclease regulator protein RraA [Labilithrix sp.]|nr:ribonuclease regulator protein RraA [Labilithrix sp.]